MRDDTRCGIPSLEPLAQTLRNLQHLRVVGLRSRFRADPLPGNLAGPIDHENRALRNSGAETEEVGVDDTVFFDHLMVEIAQEGEVDAVRFLELPQRKGKIDADSSTCAFA